MNEFNVQVGFQVFLTEGGEEIGAVRQVERNHVVVYVEGSGDFTVTGEMVKSAHDGKLVLDATKIPGDMRHATGHAHDAETE